MKLNVARDWHTDEIHPGKCENVWPGNLVTIEMRQRAPAPGSLALAFTLLSLLLFVLCSLTLRIRYNATMALPVHSGCGCVGKVKKILAELHIVI